MNKFMLVNLRTHEMDHLNKLSKLNQRNRSNLSNHLNLNCQNLDTHISWLSSYFTMNSTKLLRNRGLTSHKLFKKNIYMKKF